MNKLKVGAGMVQIESVAPALRKRRILSLGIDYKPFLTDIILEDIISEKLEINLEDPMKSFREILSRCVLDVERQEEVRQMNKGDVLFKVLDEFKEANEDFFIESESKNPFYDFLSAVKEQAKNVKNIREQRRKASFEANRALANTLTVTMKEIDNMCIEELKYQYQNEQILEEARDYSNDKKEKVFKKICREAWGGDLDESECNSVLNNLGWFITKQIPPDTVTEILANKQDEDKVEEIILRLSNDSFLKEIVDKIRSNKIIINRIEIIDACLQAYENKNYWAFIPMILTQLEGIIIGNYSDLKSTYSMDELKSRIKDLTNRHATETEEASRKFYFDTLLAPFELGKTYKELSRHSILHGYNITYGTKGNALKLLYYFEYMLYLICKTNEMVEAYQHLKLQK